MPLSLAGVVAVGGCTLETGDPDGAADGDPVAPEATSDTGGDEGVTDGEATQGAGGVDDEAGTDEGTQAADDADTTTVRVYFSNPDIEPEPEVFPVERDVAVPAVLAGALGELVEGPDEAEEEEGFTSFFSEETADLIESVRLDDDGTAYVDFDASLPEVIPEASSSTGSATLTAALDATATQFDTVDEAVYRLEGDVDAFYLWLQLTPPE